MWMDDHVSEIWIYELMYAPNVIKSYSVLFVFLFIPNILWHDRWRVRMKVMSPMMICFGRCSIPGLDWFSFFPMKIEAKQMCAQTRITALNDHSREVKCFSGSHNWIPRIVATIMMWRVQFCFEILHWNHSWNHPWSHSFIAILEWWHRASSSSSSFGFLVVENC